MASILSAQGFPSSVVVDLQRTLSQMLDLRRLIPGHRYEIARSTSGEFLQLAYQPDLRTAYVVKADENGGYIKEVVNTPTFWAEELVTGQTTENIYKDLLREYKDETFVANLVSDLGDRIFAWRIDFFSEQRIGDRYAFLIEREYLSEGKKPLPSIRILAALYEGSGTKNKKNMAFRYKCAECKRGEYFDENGEASKRIFMRAPFTHKAFRISSSYSRSRFHPVLRIWRPHHGTDFAAPIGTPVSAIGSGKVVFAGWKGGYGNCIDIRHNSQYQSRYGHLSKILVKAGDKVDQGQTIGKVGNTGVSTGPHLHFEMHVYGQQKNFARLNFPSVQKISKGDMAGFQKIRESYQSKLDKEPDDIQISVAQVKPKG